VENIQNDFAQNIAFSKMLNSPVTFVLCFYFFKRLDTDANCFRTATGSERKKV
jgi:hypothetical protein